MVVRFLDTTSAREVRTPVPSSQMENLGLTGSSGRSKGCLHSRVSQSGRTFASAVESETPSGPHVEHARLAFGPRDCHSQGAAKNDGLAVESEIPPQDSPLATLLFHG